MKITILRGSLFAGALAALCSMLFVLPASASYEDCDKLTFCLYTGESGTGSAQRLALKDGDKALAYDGTWNEKTVSIANNTPLWACLYENTQYGAALQAVAPGAKGDLATLATPGAPAGNNLAGKVSSHKLVSAQSLCFTGYERCTDDKVCIFREKNGRGPMFETAIDYRQYAGGWEANVQSVRNRTGTAVCFYNEHTWSGTFPSGAKAYRVNRGDSTSLAGEFAGTFGSHKFTTSETDSVCP
ncbi:peptidase inhibitor family I36 protein [Streptomyces sp. NPDC002073]|uniref:peptidase inhibitor family I36 protein n=1 Tax=Streptomyces sp. NBC_00239 TaxID=2903640 RepID=UPI002E29B5C3|nr:peptidase inhibitor family I36 protein [Streptomyces sp. NBC_00239]